MLKAKYEVVEVHLPDPEDDEPALAVFGVEPGGQRSLLQVLRVGPFADWESISRQIMRQVILAAGVTSG